MTGVPEYKVGIAVALGVSHICESPVGDRYTISSHVNVEPDQICVIATVDSSNIFSTIFLSGELSDGGGVFAGIDERIISREPVAI